MHNKILKEQPMTVDSDVTSFLECSCLSVSVMPCKAIPESLFSYYAMITVCSPPFVST